MKSGCITDTSRIFSGGVQHLAVTFILCSEKKTKVEEKSLDEKIIGRARSAWRNLVTWPDLAVTQQTTCILEAKLQAYFQGCIFIRQSPPAAQKPLTASPFSVLCWRLDHCLKGSTGVNQRHLLLFWQFRDASNQHMAARIKAISSCNCPSLQ